MTSVCGQIQAGGKNDRHDGAPRTVFQQHGYILPGEGEEPYTPRFTFHGFRYVELTSFPTRWT
jgi:alpha-L-rhamnosidase